MKKVLLITGVIVLALGALGVGVVFAQGGQPPVTGMMGNGGYGWMHDYVEQALAAKLGLTEKQVEDQLAAGTAMYQIALDNGIKQEDLATFMNEVHQAAFDKAAAHAEHVPERIRRWQLPDAQRPGWSVQSRTGDGSRHDEWRTRGGHDVGAGKPEPVDKKTTSKRPADLLVACS
jgi:hypothetical protein